MRTMIRLSVVAMMITLFTATFFIQPAMAGDTSKLDRAVDNALKKLCAKSYAARELSKDSKRCFGFPEYHEGGISRWWAIWRRRTSKDGKTVGYYNTVAASYGLQAGAQKFGYAMFFMDTASLEYLNKSEGWEIGVGPSIVIVDEGMAKTMTTSTDPGRYLCLHLQPAGANGGTGYSGIKNLQDQPMMD